MPATAPLFLVVPNARADHFVARVNAPAARPVQVRRRPDRTQGKALEVLGHAIDYLADARLWDGRTMPGDAEAMRLLMSCSRAVFQECDEVVPVRKRLMHWLGQAPESAGTGL